MTELTQLFDYAILGTDTTSSILAAALARLSRKVIHLDSPAYFGSTDASLSFTELQAFMTAPDSASCSRRSVQVQPVNPTQSPESVCLKSSRRFSIDLLPKLIYANGEVVDKLIQSGVSDYLEFKSVQTGVIWTGGAFETVPFDMPGIMLSSLISISEKRQLMKFIGNCQRTLEEHDLAKDFRDFMQEMSLTTKLQEVILYGVLLDQGGPLSVGAAASRLKEYSESLGRYKNNKALLYPMYGSSDISQAYCRLAAVHGAVYCLSVDFSSPAIQPNEDHYVIQTSLGDIKAQHVICGSAFAAQSIDPSVESFSQTESFHGFIISTTQLFAAEDDDPVLLSIPPGRFQNSSPVYILQLSSSTNTVAPDHFLYHVGFLVQASDDIAGIFDRLATDLPIDIVCRCSYVQHSNCRSSALNIVHLPDIQGDFDFKANFEIAQMTFCGLEVDAEFLPKRSRSDVDETDRDVKDS